MTRNELIREVATDLYLSQVGEIVGEGKRETEALIVTAARRSVACGVALANALADFGIPFDEEGPAGNHNFAPDEDESPGGLDQAPTTKRRRGQ